ncbi:MAG: rhamnulokinase [Clostridiaceae bacterium]|nr:rhamnulokinase [Clostridiaceae bacterium]
MCAQKNVLAFDAGGGSTRMLQIGFSGSRLDIRQIARYNNGPVIMGKSLYWDILGIWRGLISGLQEVCAGGSEIASLGIDTWGNDFVLLDKKGYMIENPYSHRDNRTAGLVEEVNSRLGGMELYSRNGIQQVRMNSMYQMYHLAKDRPYILEMADKVLFLPDLLAYHLTGEQYNEYTMATISQLYSYEMSDWDQGLMEMLGIPRRIFSSIVMPGTEIGRVMPSLSAEAGIDQLRLTAVGSHDTGSAVAAVPELDGPVLYISSGTWSIVGTETDTPVINAEAYRLNYSNEGGVNDRIRLLKNVMGLWIMQEIRRKLTVDGRRYTFSELSSLAEAAEPFSAFIDPDDEAFYEPSDMPETVREYCIRTGQKAPEDTGSIVRIVLESLAFKYRYVIEGLERITGNKYERIHIVGGGSQNALLNAFTANCCSRPVYAGPSEATALGNGLVQLISLGELSDYTQARSIIRSSFPPEIFPPHGSERWDEQYHRFIRVTGLEERL